MAVVFANSQGVIQGLRHDASEEKLSPVPPGPNAAYVLRFDEKTNAGILSAYDTNSQAFSMAGGTLNQGGVPVTINPPGLLYAALQDAAGILSKAKNTTDPFTRDEVAAIAVAAFHALGIDG